MTITKEIVDPMLSFITKVTAFRVSSSSQGKALRDAAFARRRSSPPSPRR